MSLNRDEHYSIYLETYGEDFITSHKLDVDKILTLLVEMDFIQEQINMIKKEISECNDKEYKLELLNVFRDLYRDLRSGVETFAKIKKNLDAKHVKELDVHKFNADESLDELNG